MKTTVQQPTEYEIQARDFLNKYNLSMAIEFQGFRKYFLDDKEKRNVYEFTLTNNTTKKEYTGTFGDSIHNSVMSLSEARDGKKRKEPTPYDILACLDVFEGHFQDFCEMFGYDSDSIKARKVYDSVIEESIGLRKVLTQEAIEALQEIN